MFDKDNKVIGNLATFRDNTPNGAVVKTDQQVDDYESIVLVPPDDVEALSGALARLADDADLRARLAAGARVFAESIAWPALAAGVGVLPA